MILLSNVTAIIKPQCGKSFNPLFADKERELFHMLIFFRGDHTVSIFDRHGQKRNEITLPG